MERMAGKASLWWDMETCPLPSYVDPYIVASIAPSLLRNFHILTSMVNDGGGCSSLDDPHFSAYEFFSETHTELDQTLINSGIGLCQLPPGKSNEVEKMMMADVLLWAMDTPPPANIIFIVGNVDFCYLFQKLQQRSYTVYLVCESMCEIPQGMLGGASGCLGCLSFLRSLQIEDQQSHIPGGISVYDYTFSDTASPTSSTSIHSKEMEESRNASSFDFSEENLFGMKLSLSDGWDSTCNFPLDETASSSVQPEPRFHGHFNKTKKPRSRPVSSASSTEKKQLASLEEFKAWLTLIVKKYAEEGYNISPIRMDFEKATGKSLDEKFLGFSKVIDLVKDCKDIAVIKELKRGCHHAFPVKPNEQKKPMPSPDGCNSNTNKNPKFKDKPRAEKTPKPKRKASAEDVRKVLYHMLQAGELSQGFLIAHLPKRFGQYTGKFLDVEHLGYKSMSGLVASCSDLVLVSCAGPGPARIFPRGL